MQISFVFEECGSLSQDLIVYHLHRRILDKGRSHLTPQALGLYSEFYMKEENLISREVKAVLGKILGVTQWDWKRNKSNKSIRKACGHYRKKQGT